MVKPFYNEEMVEVEGEPLRLVINFKAIDATESLLRPRDYTDILDELVRGQATLSTQAKIVWGLLREHHPEMTLDHASALLFGTDGVKVGLVVSRLMNAAFPPAEEPKAKAKNPRKPRGASKPS